MSDVGRIFLSFHWLRMRNKILKRFGNKVRIHRNSLGISQMKLAELTGCSLQAIGNIERGRANPSLIMVYRLANALRLTPKELVT